MEDKINTGSQEFSALNNDKPNSPVNREISDEVTETVEVTEGGSFAIDPKTETMKRKRGRPRNQEVDHANMKSPLASPTAVVLSQFPENSSVKRNRGRPKGSGKLQILATIGGYFAATAGGNFHPHAVIVNPGEDIVGKIIPFVAMPHQVLNILSAVGTVSSVLIYQPTSSPATTAFEGSFEILSLSGLYKYHNKHSVEGRLSISLAKPDGQVFGGIVGGPIIAENPIQLIVATFKQNAILKFQKRMKNLSSKVSVPGSRLGDSDKMVRFPTDTGTMTEDAIIPTTEPLPLESAHGDGGEDTVTPENENDNDYENWSPDSPKSIDVNALQVLQTNSKTSEDAVTFINKDTNVGEIDALKDCQSPSDEKTSSGTVDEDSDSEN